jgi:hypothetical protein
MSGDSRVLVSATALVVSGSQQASAQMASEQAAVQGQKPPATRPDHSVN